LIYVCDAIMGSGKSSAAIQYMNDHQNEKFIYVTPYLEEDDRIKENCPALHFVKPSAAYSKYNHKKIQHTAALIKQGKNIATTHQAFGLYTDQMLDDIREHGYNLIIDEAISIFAKCEFNVGDIQTLAESGYIRKDENGSYIATGKEYTGSRLRDAVCMVQSKNLVRVRDYKSLYYWEMPIELIKSFQNVFILTYLFEGQSMCYHLKIHNIEYTYIHVQKDNGCYRFSSDNKYIPEYVQNIKSKIHILDHEYLNQADLDWRSQKHSEKALSKGWFESTKNEERIQELKDDLHMLFNKLWPEATAKNSMWGTFKTAERKLRGKGYSNGFVVFNERATNKYRNKKYLAYLANIFMNVPEKLHYQSSGLYVNEDAYALSVLVQWIWRSAIRDGEEIWLYLPSIRMRRLLTEWMDRLESGQTQ